MFGEKKYIYVAVCFKRGNHPYSYLTKDSTIKINDVVIVPTAEGEKAAIVTGVDVYKKSEVPYPVEKTKHIIRKATKIESADFAGADMRIPIVFDRKPKPLKAYWTQRTHLLRADEYICSACGHSFKKATPFCPKCNAKMMKSQYDPSWVDEAEIIQ